MKPYQRQITFRKGYRILSKRELESIKSVVTYLYYYPDITDVFYLANTEGFYLVEITCTRPFSSEYIDEKKVYTSHYIVSKVYTMQEKREALTGTFEIPNGCSKKIVTVNNGVTTGTGYVYKNMNLSHFDVESRFMFSTVDRYLSRGIAPKGMGVSIGRYWQQ